MRKLSLYVFLGLLICNNVNGDLNSKDKFIFYRCDANALNDHYQVNYDKSIWENWGWEINLKKKTATNTLITTSGKKLRLKNIQEFEQEYAIYVRSKRYEIFAGTTECCDVPNYTFNIKKITKKGEIIIDSGWGRRTVIKCKIFD